MIKQCNQYTHLVEECFLRKIIMEKYITLSDYLNPGFRIFTTSLLTSVGGISPL